MAARASIYWSIIGNWTAFVASLTCTVIIARLLNPHQMGVFTMAIAVMAILQGIFGTGLGRYVFTQEELSREQLGTLFLITVGQGLALSLVLAVIAPVIGGLRHEPELTKALLILAAVPTPMAIDSLWVALQARDFRFRTITIGIIARAFTAMAVTIWLALEGWGALSQAIGMAASTLVSLAVSCVLARPLIRMSLSLKHRREVMSLLGQSTGNAAAYSVSQRIPDLVLGGVLSLSLLGQWGRASNTVDMVRRQLVDPMSLVQLPVMANEQNSPPPDRTALLRFNTVFSGLLWPVLMVLALLAKPVVSLLFGPQWDIAAQILPILCLYNMIHLGAMGASEVWFLAKRINDNTRFEVARAALLILLLLPASKFGVLGVAWAMLIEAAMAFAWKFRVITVLGGASSTRLFQAYAQALMLCAAAAAPTWIIMTVLGWPRTMPIWQLALTCVATAISWLATAFLLRHPVAEEAMRIVRSRGLRVFAPEG